MMKLDGAPTTCFYDGSVIIQYDVLIIIITKNYIYLITENIKYVKIITCTNDFEISAVA